MSRIIDIHTHMLYGIDDGSNDRAETLKLIEMAFDQGIRGIFFTNHSYGMIDSHLEYHKHFDKIQETISEMYPDLSVYKGCEVLCFKDEISELVEGIRSGIYPTMNGTKYVLLEFKSNSLDDTLYCLEYTLDKGYIPIVAHVERYNSMYKDPLEDLMRIRNLGCKVQINLYSVEQDRGSLGESRKRLANQFLDHRLVDFVGSDTHNLNYKSTEAAVGAQKILEKVDRDYAERVLYRNAEDMLIYK